MKIELPTFTYVVSKGFVIFQITNKSYFYLHISIKNFNILYYDILFDDYNVTFSTWVCKTPNSL